MALRLRQRRNGDFWGRKASPGGNPPGLDTKKPNADCLDGGAFRAATAEDRESATHQRKGAKG